MIKNLPIFSYLKAFYFIVSCLYMIQLEAIDQTQHSHYVLVSVAPYKFFVEKIAGDTIQIGVMVPAAASFHTFEPTPRQMVAASKADLWFRIGEGFESKMILSLQNHNPKMKLIDLREGLDLIACHGNHICSHHESYYDLHFWLSPQMAKKQATRIAETLINTYPEHAQKYQQNLKHFLNELNLLDNEIKQLFEKPHNSIVMVSHPAYAYFCRDYGCSQLAIEFEGKDPTPYQLTETLNSARKAKIKTIFIQPQHSNKGAKLIASQLEAQIITLDPYSEDYFNSLRQIAHAFVEQTRKNN